MDFLTLISTREPCLCEGSIFEKLCRDPNVEVDPEIFHAALIYDDHGSSVLEHAHRDYIDLGQRMGIPMIVTTNTWRANFERIERSRFKGARVNQDDVAFMNRLRDSYGEARSPIYIGGQIGPRGDAYKPLEAPEKKDAAIFHQPQVEALCEGDIDFLIAATLPALSEAQGIAQSMATTGRPYLLSFVVRGDGTILDGTPLVEAIRRIDEMQSVAPTAYFVNCVHPQIFAEALDIARRDDPVAAARVIGFYANTSDLSPEDLDGSDELLTETPEYLADLMSHIHTRQGIPILGGCCGTDTEHIKKIGDIF